MKQLRRKIYLAWRRLMGHDNEVFHPHGITIRLPHGNDLAIRYMLAKNHPYEQAEADGVRTLIAPGQDVLELGGSIGVISAVIRRQIGPQARHLIVEADARLAAICAENASRGAAPDKTEVIQAAVDYSGATEIRFALGRNAHVGRLAASGAAGVPVPVVRLADLAARLPQDGLALVSDIEGAELAMIANEPAVLARVSVLILETHPKNYPNGVADLAIMLQQVRAAGLRQVSKDHDVYCFKR